MFKTGSCSTTTTTTVPSTKTSTSKATKIIQKLLPSNEKLSEAVVAVTVSTANDEPKKYKKTRNISTVCCPTSNDDCCKRDDRYSTSFVRQLSLLLHRTFLILKRDKTLTTMRFIIHCTMAPLIGLLYFGIGNEAEHVRDNLNYIFYSIMFLMFTAFSAMSVACKYQNLYFFIQQIPLLFFLKVSVWHYDNRVTAIHANWPTNELSNHKVTLSSYHFTVPLELPIITREHFNRWYSLRAYYIAMTLADIPIQILCSLVYLVVTYLMTEQPLQWQRFGLFVAICIMVCLVAQALGLLVGAIFSVKVKKKLMATIFLMSFI